MTEYFDSPKDPRSGKCPGCGREFEYDGQAEPAYLPFCSDRCQWVDLGKWLGGEYFVSRSLLRDNDEQDD